MPSKDRSVQYATYSILLGVALFLWWYAFGYESRRGIGRQPDSPARTPAAEQEAVALGAAVQFTGTQFQITNNDPFNWANCELAINAGAVRQGYELRAVSIAARSTMTVGAMQFARGDGQRFNPFDMKPNAFSIACDTPGGRRYYFGQ